MNLFKHTAEKAPTDYIEAVPDLPPEPPDGCTPILTPQVLTDPYLKMLYRQMLSGHECFTSWSPDDPVCGTCPAQIECVEALSARLTGEDKVAKKTVAVAAAAESRVIAAKATPNKTTSWTTYTGPFDGVLDRGLYQPMTECGVPTQPLAFAGYAAVPVPAWRLFKAQQDHLKRHEITLSGRGDWFPPVEEYFRAGPEACDAQAQVIEES